MVRSRLIGMADIKRRKVFFRGLRVATVSLQTQELSHLVVRHF